MQSDNAVGIIELPQQSLLEGPLVIFCCPWLMRFHPSASLFTRRRQAILVHLEGRRRDLLPIGPSRFARLRYGNEIWSLRHRYSIEKITINGKSSGAICSLGVDAADKGDLE